MKHVKLFEQFVSEYDYYDSRAPWNQDDEEVYAHGDLEFDLMIETVTEFLEKGALEKFISEVDSLITKEMKKSQIKYTLANPFSSYGYTTLQGTKYFIGDGLAWTVKCTVKERIPDDELSLDIVKSIMLETLPDLKQVEALARKYKIKVKKVYLVPLDWSDFTIIEGEKKPTDS